MRILHCIPSMLGGGAERQVCYLAGGLVRLGHGVDVVYMLDGPNTPRLRATGADLHPLGWRRTFDPRLPFQIAQIIRETKADLVQTWLTRMDVMGALAARLTRRPYVYSERYVVVARGDWRERMRRRLVDGAAAVVANSEAGAAYWREQPHHRSSTYVVRNGLPIDELDAVPRADRQAIGVPEGAEFILHAGRMDPQKNIAGLAHVIGSVLEQRPRAFAMCCGIGPELDVLRAEISRRGLEARCLLPGYRTDVWALMKAADVFISASHHEGHPNSVLEAMACRVPLVVSDIAEHRECVPADGALFFPPASSAAGAAAIARVLDDKRATTERMQSARRAAEVLSIDAMARQYEVIYRRLLSARVA